MSGRKWEAGDVAIGPWPDRKDGGSGTYTEQRISRFSGRTTSGWALTSDPDDYLLDSDERSPGSRARPLYLLDLEDAAGIDDFCKALVEAMYERGDVSGAAQGVHPDAVRMALEHLFQQKIPEPDDLGALVCDDKGRLFVRVSLDGNADWYRIGDQAIELVPAVLRFDDIHAVEQLTSTEAMRRLATRSVTPAVERRQR